MRMPDGNFGPWAASSRGRRAAVSPASAPAPAKLATVLHLGTVGSIADIKAALAGAEIAIAVVPGRMLARKLGRSRYDQATRGGHRQRAFERWVGVRPARTASRGEWRRARLPGIASHGTCCRGLGRDRCHASSRIRRSGGRG